MNTYPFCLLTVALATSALVSSSNLVRGAENRAGTSAVVERGAHHRVTEKATEHTRADGSVITEVTRRVDLAAGLHYREGETWVEAQDLIEPHPDGAVAHRGQVKCAFAANLNTSGAIQVVDADGRRFTTHLLGLMATDAANGQSVTIATVKNSIGQIVPPNRIVYADAFSGAVKADVIYVVTRSGFEQFVRITEAPPATFLADNNLSLETTRLETITEVLEAPGGTITTETLKAERDPVVRAGMVLPDFINQQIHFGALALPRGKAIDLGGAVVMDIPVGTTWEVANGRSFIVEAIEWSAAQPALDILPAHQARVNGAVRGLHAKVEPKGNFRNLFLAKGDQRDVVSRSFPLTPALSPKGARESVSRADRVARPFPAAPRLRAAVDRQPMKQMASVTNQSVPRLTALSPLPSHLNSGLLLDYSLTLTAGLTNWVFRPEATHYVSGPVNLYGTNTIVGGTIVKFAGQSANPHLAFHGTVVCDTTPYHPAVFMAVDDHSFGDNFGSGSPSGYYATAALRASSNVVGELHDLRISHAQVGIDWAGSSERFYNLQFINCSNAVRRVDATSAGLHNILLTNVLWGFTGSNSTLYAQHVTANRVGTLANLTGSPSTLSLTNSILFHVTNAGAGTITLDYVATNGTASLPAATHGLTVSAADFEAAVGGYHYLSNSSSLHDAGTTVIHASLLSELSKLTTYAPTLLSSTTTVNVTFSPNVPRDFDAPDLGYHYAPLDYVLRGYRLNTNVVLTMTNGVAVGIDFNGQSWGLIFETATNVSIGSPTNMNRVVRAHNVQERSTGNPGTRAMFYDIGDTGTHGDSAFRHRFTEFGAMAADGFAFHSGKNWKTFEWSHCWIYNLSITLTANKGSQTFGVTNSLFEWSDATLTRGGSSSAFHLRNNLFRTHNLNIAGLNSLSTLRDCLFDNQIVYTNGTTISHSHNAFYLTTNNSSHATNALPGLNNNLPLTSLSCQSDPYGRYGPYGRYYQPGGSSLINAGSQGANAAGLYHFATTTNQVKETTSTVDIGLHYVGLNASSLLIDTDSDGVPDYYEDFNGNGSHDTGEINWQDADTDDDGVPDGVELLQGRNPMGGTTPDTANTLNLRVFSPLK